MDSLAAGLALALGLVLLGLLLLSLRRPIMARIGVRNIPRRPAQSVLIVLGLTLSTTIIIAALSIGDTLDYSIRRYAVDAYGLIDEVLAPPFIQDLLTLAEEDGSLNASDSSSPEAQLLTTLAAGDLNSLLALFQEGLPGIPQERVQALRADLAADPQVDGVAGAIFFPTIVRDLDTGQGEPLAFIFAVDQAYDQEFGLHTAEGDPVRVADLRPGVGPLFTGAAELYRAANELATQTGSALGLDVEGLPQTALALGAAAVLLSADPPPTFTLRELRVDVATLETLGLDVAFLREQGIDVIRLESLGISDEQLAQLGIDPDAPITLPTLQALGLDLPGITQGATELLSGFNLNTLGQDLDASLGRVGLQLRQGEVYLNRLGAQQLNARPGDLLEIFIGPIPVPYRVQAIVEESGPLGVLSPVVMMDVAEAQQLLFMQGRVNAILVSNQGDALAGPALTEPVSRRLQALSLNEAKLAQVMAILNRDEVADILVRAGDRARNPVVNAPREAPEFLRNLAEGLTGTQDFQVHVQALTEALAQPQGTPPSEAVRAALANPAVRAWILEQPLPQDVRLDLEDALADLDDFQLFPLLTKQFALEGADIAGVGFSAMFTVFGAFSILAGLLLIFLIFVMLASERRRELGIARAVGTQRGHLMQMFVTEGMVYDLAAALVGLGLGLGVAFGMVGLLGPFFQNVGAQVSGQELPFRLRWSVAPPSLVIGYSLGVLLTFLVVGLASWRMTRLNIVSAIRGLPDMDGRGASRLGRAGRFLAGPGLLLLGIGALLAWADRGLTLRLVGFTLLLVGGCLSLDGLLTRFSRLRAGRRHQLVYSAMGLGLLILWATPWATVIGSQETLFGQDPLFLLLSFVLSGPLVITGVILLVMFNADSLAGLAVRLLGGVGPLTPVLKTAIAFPLSNRFRTGVAMILFAMVITTVTVMSVVIQATEVVSTPSQEATAGFDIELSPGLLSGFAPVTDLAQEMAARPDFPREMVVVVGSVSGLDAEARQAGDAVWLPMEITGVDAGYTQQAGEVYGFRLRAEGYADDAAVWQALAQRDDVMVVAPWRVQGELGSGGEFEGPHRRGFLRLDGFTLDDPVIPPTFVELRRPLADGGLVVRRVQVIGVLEPRETLAGGSLQVNRRLLDALNGEPVRPEHFYVRVAPGVDVHEAAQALERSLLNSGFNATVLAERFAAGQAALRGILRLFQGFLALGLVVGIAGLGVISSRGVVERRQQIGVLRAIGYSPASVALLFVVEASFIAVTGMLTGAVTGMVLGDKMFGQFYTLATDQVFPLPWASVAGILLLAYAVSLLAVILPAWQASRIYPAEALRYE